MQVRLQSFDFIDTQAATTKTPVDPFALTAIPHKSRAESTEPLGPLMALHITVPRSPHLECVASLVDYCLVGYCLVGHCLVDFCLVDYCVNDNVIP